MDTIVDKLEAERRPDYVTVASHNGTFTVLSVATGQHRTFRVKTQSSDARFAPGKRVLSLLVGPDNGDDYVEFAFVDDDGVHVWDRVRTTWYVKLAAMLKDLAEHEAAGRVVVFVATRCRVCNRLLTTPESVRSGIGPMCDGR